MAKRAERHGGEEIAELRALEAAPADERLREDAARALTRAGRHAEAVAVLGEGLVNLTAHDGPTLPCLCRRCLQPALAEASAEGMSFVRRFVVARGRVLYYWAPAQLGEDAGLRHSVRSRLERRLGGRA